MPKLELAMTDPDPAVTPLTEQRARAAIRIVAQAVQAGELAVSYGELARRLGMSKVNGQGLNAYLIQAAAICAEHGLPNIGALIASQDSLAAGTPMPAEGTLSDSFFTKTGLSRGDVPAEQARLRAVDWAGALVRLSD